jgi:hypothetical protein
MEKEIDQDEEIFCWECGEYVVCNRKCTECEIFLEAMNAKRGVDYP